MTSQGKWASFGTGIMYFVLVASGTTPSQTGASASTDKIERARIAFSHHREQQMLGSDVAVLEIDRFS